ncbi:hypothetical protein [Rubritalea tangerina]|uniref:hypothetical protein n=1 Tax=Rubritalea tangerina TaxID=430798 RepID=UPI0036243958
MRVVWVMVAVGTSFLASCSSWRGGSEEVPQNAGLGVWEYRPNTISRLGIDEWSVIESGEVCASRF